MSDPVTRNQLLEEPAHRSFAESGGRWRAYVAATLADHGIFRLAYRNLHTVAPGMMRSNQPYPHQIAQAARAGVRTIINLRGRAVASTRRLEREAVLPHRIKML